MSLYPLFPNEGKNLAQRTYKLVGVVPDPAVNVFAQSQAPPFIRVKLSWVDLYNI
jgi:hypothetical protein